MSGAWGSGQYADPADPNNRSAWDTDGDGIIEVNPAEARQRFYFPSATVTDPTYINTAEQVAGALAKQSDLQETQSDVFKLQDIAAAARATLSYISPDIQDMPSFPWYMMQLVPQLTTVPGGALNWAERTVAVTERAGGQIRFTGRTSSEFVPSGGGNDGSVAPGHWHSHTFDEWLDLNHTHELRMVSPTYLPQSTSLELSVIPCDRVAYLEQLKFCSGRDEKLFAVDSMRAGLYALDPMDGILKLVWRSGEIRDSYQQTQKMYALDLRDRTTGSGPECTPGQVLFAAVWQRAGKLFTGTRQLGCMFLPMYEPNTRSWLKTGAFTLAGQSEIPLQIPYMNLVPNYQRQFWAALTTG